MRRRALTLGLSIGLCSAVLTTSVGGSVAGLLDANAVADASASGVPSMGTWHHQRVAATTSVHLDEPPPGVDPARPLPISTLVDRSGVTRKPARFVQQPHRLLGSSSETTAAGSQAASAVLSVPAGVPALAGLSAHVAPSCTGTGTDGKRVQLLYAYEKGRANSYSALLTTLRSYAADVDDTFALSSRQSGRRVRWVTDGSCRPDVRPMTVPAGTFTGNDGLDAMDAALAAKGYDRTDRKYLVFADAAQICGIGELWTDSRSSPSNANNSGHTTYARVDRGCWPTPRDYHSTVAHELMHMLGGIQADAPHATTYGHCTDESDAMCYDDGSRQAMRYRCTAGRSEAVFDCRNDDYYADGEPAGSYLPSHWNTAGSDFLDTVPALAPMPVRPPGASVSLPTSLRPGLSGNVLLTPDEKVSVVWESDRPDCLVAEATPDRLRLQCRSDAAPGTVAVRASMRAADGRRDSVTRFVTVGGPAAALSVQLDVPAKTHVGSAATLRAHVRYGTSGVRSRLALQVYSDSSRAWSTIKTASSSRFGNAAFTVRRNSRGARSFRVVVDAGPHSGWTARGSRAAVVTWVRRATSIASSVHAGRPDVLRGTVRTSLGTPVIDEVIRLQYHYRGSSAWHALTTRRTGSTGVVVARVQPRRSTYYRWVFAGSTLLSTSTGTSQHVRY